MLNGPRMQSNRELAKGYALRYARSLVSLYGLASAFHCGRIVAESVARVGLGGRSLRFRRLIPLAREELIQLAYETLNTEVERLLQEENANGRAV